MGQPFIITIIIIITIITILLLLLLLLILIIIIIIIIIISDYYYPHICGTIVLLKFLLITQHKVPFINMSEAKKCREAEKTTGKCANVTNRRSRLTS